MEEVATHPFLSGLESRLDAVRTELAQLLAETGAGGGSVQPAPVTSKAGYLRVSLISWIPTIQGRIHEDQLAQLVICHPRPNT